ncbi:hypothetical protein D0Z00_002851 [Geotrichum galactomycetum]|uniref:Uncharacterized protein n=1 Tax=Geotrichum galactomycetum TaxID=27317 RepID=A0ACB6V339_9ASCO|nr:hypothetical protein D0Z00_002851 [Geotrichum candidum]
MSRSKFARLVKNDLQGLARGFGLNDEGRKIDLEDRLVEYFHNHKEELVRNSGYSKFFNLSDLEDGSSSSRSGSTSSVSNASSSASPEKEDEEGNEKEVVTEDKKIAILEPTIVGSGEEFRVALRGVDVFYNSFKTISSNVGRTVITENVKLQKKLSSVPVITTLFVGFETGLILFHHLFNYYLLYQNVHDFGADEPLTSPTSPVGELISLLKLVSFYGGSFVLLPIVASFYFNLTSSRLPLDPLIFALAKLMLSYFIFVGSSASAPLTELLGTAGYADRLHGAVGNVPFFTAFAGILLAIYDTLA